MTPAHTHGRPRLAVALTFPVHPPQGGGQVRVYELYRELARSHDVEVVSLGPTGEAERRRQLAPGLWEHRVPKSVEHAAREMDLERQAGTVVTDVAMGRLHRYTPAYGEALHAASDGAEAVVASHPYTYGAIRDATDAPLLYEAHNVETTLKAEVLTGGALAAELLVEVSETEAACCREARLVWTCSTQDRDELARRYGIPRERIIVVPNGVAVQDLPYTAPSRRSEHRRRLRMRDRPLALFIASWHQPNVVAAGRVLDLARAVPELSVMVVGSVGNALGNRPLPANVQLAGVVSTEFKQAVLSIADVALNPVTSGSGTNIKMLDYFAAGTPVISTAFGARGLGVVAGEHYIAADADGFEMALGQLRAVDLAALDAMTSAARAHVEADLSWRAIADRLREALSALPVPSPVG